MRSTAVRLSTTFPAGFSIRWPLLCSVCGASEVAGTVATVKQAPPVPYCLACLRVHRRLTGWIRSWLVFALLFVLGPLLYMGAIFDRPLASQNIYWYSQSVYMAFAFFAVVFSAIAAGIGFTRRSELQGIETNEIRSGEVDDPGLPLDNGRGMVEVRFKNPEFYSATLDRNRQSE